MSDNPIVPRTGSADVVEFETDKLPDVGAALAQLHAAIRDMRADDLSIEFTNTNDGDGRSKSHFRLRAYRQRS
jgi:hypothetical protein